jgi:hypothetical protein
MARQKKNIKNFNQYLVNFRFYYLTSFSKQKSMLKLQLFSPTASPDEAIAYVNSIVATSFMETFKKSEFNKNTMRFEEISFIKNLSGELAKHNLGTNNDDKIKNLSAILKKHLLS